MRASLIANAGGSEADIMAAAASVNKAKAEKKEEPKKEGGEDKAALRAMLVKMSTGGDDAKPDAPKVNKGEVKNKEKELIAKIK